MRAILDIWSFRTFILGSIRREISSRYKGTVMGSAWVVINPLMMIIIYTVIFSQVMHSRLNGVGGTYSYSIFLCAGLLPWLFFSDLVSKCQGAFVDNGNLLKKMHFPRGCLLVIALGNAGFNFLVIFTIFQQRFYDFDDEFWYFYHFDHYSQKKKGLYLLVLLMH